MKRLMRKRKFRENEIQAAEVYVDLASKIHAHSYAIKWAGEELKDEALFTQNGFSADFAAKVQNQVAAMAYTSVMVPVEAALGSRQTASVSANPKAATAELMKAINEIVQTCPEIVAHLVDAVSFLEEDPEFKAVIITGKKVEERNDAKLAHPISGPEQTRSAVLPAEKIIFLLIHWLKTVITLEKLWLDAMKAWEQNVTYKGFPAVKAELIKINGTKMRDLVALIQNVSARISAFGQHTPAGKKAFERATAAAEKDLQPAGKKIVSPVKESGAVVLDKKSAVKLHNRKVIEKMVYQHMRKLGVLPVDRE